MLRVSSLVVGGVEEALEHVAYLHGGRTLFSLVRNGVILLVELVSRCVALPPNQTAVEMRRRWPSLRRCVRVRRLAPSSHREMTFR